MRGDYQKSIEEYGREALLEELQAFFKSQDKYVMIRWEQYTPYFNDGEACVFSVYEPHFFTPEHMQEMEEEDDYYFEFEGDYISTWRSREKMEKEYGGDEAKMMAYDVAKMLESNSDLLKAVFGDHTRVTVKPDGVHSEHYDHD